MTATLRPLVCTLMALALATGIASAQTATATGTPPDGFGGGEATSRAADHLSDAEIKAIQARLAGDIERLRPAARALPGSESTVSFTWPLRAANGLNDPDFHGISNFVDQDRGSSGLLDYQCNPRTYDGHGGTDFFTWPFGWLLMDNDQVEVVAAAPGVIVGRDDGNFDRSCSWTGGQWNAVYIMHADESVAWYGHLKNGSVTSKQVGQSVARGEYLGVVGSSGNSTGPHLHLHVFDPVGNLNDPFAGPCNSLNPSSWWADQRLYYDSAINKVMSGFNVADFGTCPEQEDPRAKQTFRTGDTAYFTTFFHDQLNTQVVGYSLWQPDGSLWWSTNHSSPASHYNASYWYWLWNSFGGTMQGIWTWRVDYVGNTWTHPFYLVDTCDSGLTLNASVNGRQTWASQDTISAESGFQVGPGDTATLLAQHRVTFDDGTSVETGGELRVAVSEGVCDVVCGNGLLEADEECDDGNNTNGDGCSSTCQLE